MSGLSSSKDTLDYVSRAGYENVVDRQSECTPFIVK